MRRTCSGLLAVLAVVGTSGCVAAPTAYERARAVATPSSDRVGGVLAGGSVVATDRDAALARATTAVLRVRNSTCDGVGTGSGFAIDAHRLVTNRHVVEGARELTLDTSDGQQRTVEIASQALDDDLAVITTEEPLPATLTLARSDARPGDLVTALGFPLGGPLSRQDGRLIDRVPGDRFETSSEVLRSDLRVRPGNSGGPLVDAGGDVVGVVFAIELSGGRALALPVSRLRTVLATGSLTPTRAEC